jgi:hypothetical protein
VQVPNEWGPKIVMISDGWGYNHMVSTDCYQYGEGWMSRAANNSVSNSSSEGLRTKASSPAPIATRGWQVGCQRKIRDSWRRTKGAIAQKPVSRGLLCWGAKKAARVGSGSCQEISASLAKRAPDGFGLHLRVGLPLTRQGP